MRPRHFNIGNAHMRAGQRDAAIIAYRKALALKPDFVDAEVGLGAALGDMGHLEEAARVLPSSIGDQSRLRAGAMPTWVMR